jgi:hypothetical protein
VADDKTDNGTDRRSLIAAVAMAGAAVPLMANGAQAQDDTPRCGNEPHPRFIVDLGNVALSREAASSLNEKIRKAFLTTVARAGAKPSIYQGHLPPYWYGIVIAPQVNIPDQR